MLPMKGEPSDCKFAQCDSRSRARCPLAWKEQCKKTRIRNWAGVAVVPKTKAEPLLESVFIGGKVKNREWGRSMKFHLISSSHIP